MMILKFNSPVEAMMYSLYSAMGSTFGVYSTPDMGENSPTIWRASPDKNFSDLRDVDIVTDVSYSAGSIASIDQFESAWIGFINDPRGRGQADISAWYYDEATDILYIGFKQMGANENVYPEYPITWPGEWGYNPDPPIWLRVSLQPADLNNFVQNFARFFWSTKYQLQK